LPQIHSLYFGRGDGLGASNCPTCKQAVEVLAYSPDGRILAEGSSDDGTISLWDTRSRKVIRTLKQSGKSNFPPTPQALAFSPDGQTIISGYDDGTLKVWDVATAQLRRSVKAGGPLLCFTSNDSYECNMRSTIDFVAFSPDYYFIVSHDAAGTTRDHCLGAGEGAERETNWRNFFSWTWQYDVHGNDSRAFPGRVLRPGEYFSRCLYRGRT
jgi:hypothetical protein